MTPFILKGSKKLPDESTLPIEHAYDRLRQLWINQHSGKPVIIELQGQPAASSFGETPITETHEGADQPDIASLEVSQFGETTITRAPHEGVDPASPTDLLWSQFGETTMTKTEEGIDQTEISSLGEISTEQEAMS